MTQIDKKEEDSDSSLDSIEKDELVRKLEKLAIILKIWKSSGYKSHPTIDYLIKELI